MLVVEPGFHLGGRDPLGSPSARAYRAPAVFGSVACGVVNRASYYARSYRPTQPSDSRQAGTERG